RSAPSSLVGRGVVASESWSRTSCCTRRTQQARKARRVSREFDGWTEGSSDRTTPAASYVWFSRPIPARVDTATELTSPPSPRYLTIGFGATARRLTSLFAPSSYRGHDQVTTAG